MPQRVVVSSLISLAGSLAVAWSVSYLVTLGPCGGDDSPPCPPEATPYFIALAVGMPAAILGGIAGRKMASFALFPAVGVGALWGATNLSGSDRTFANLFGLAFLASVLVPVFLIRRSRQRARLAMRLFNEGRAAIGTITGVEDTGVTVNRNPRVRMTLHIEPEDGSASFDGTKTSVVSRLDPPRRGRRYPVWYDPADRSQFIMVTKVDDSAPPRVHELFQKAAAAGPVAGESETGTSPSGEPADPLDRLAKLNELRLAGALTEEEFAVQKAKLLQSD